MRLPFDPVRFLGHLLWASLGAGLVTILTFMVTWQLSGNASSLSVGFLTSSIVLGLLVFLPMIIPAAVASLAASWVIRTYLPVIEPGGGGMILILGAFGVIVEMLLAFTVGVADASEVGRYMLLSVGVGGALCGVIVGWRTKE